MEVYGGEVNRLIEELEDSRDRLQDGSETGVSHNKYA